MPQDKSDKKESDKPRSGKGGDNNELLEELNRSNIEGQQRQLDYLKGIQHNKKGGVDAKEAF